MWPIHFFFSLLLCARIKALSSPSLSITSLCALCSVLLIFYILRHGQLAVAETWRRVWGDGKFFRGPRFLNDFFLVIDQIFRIFSFFSQISRIFTKLMLNVII